MTKQNKILLFSGIAALLFGISIFFYLRDTYFNPNWKIVSRLEGNIFPSVILSTAMTPDSLLIENDTTILGNPKSVFGIRITTKEGNALMRIQVDESPYFYQTITELILPLPNKTYFVYPNLAWKYEKLKSMTQAEPVDIQVKVKLDKQDLGVKYQTMSVRSINECLMGYLDLKGQYHSTGIFFAAYVNEEHPMIEEVLKQALDARVVKRFAGYQLRSPESVKRQVYAIWNSLQKRNFRYSSLTNTSLSSSIILTQRVRTLDDAFKSTQLNCVDGTVLFASVLKAIGIDPILIKTPGHMLVGFYLDKRHKQPLFLETTMIGNVDLDEYFSEEQVKGLEDKTQDEVSLATFEKAIETGNKKYANSKQKIEAHADGYLYLEITKDVRKRVQPIGK